MDPAKLKVVELRQELQARGLDTKGVKAVLVDRLRLALEQEGAAIRDQVLGVSPTKSDGHRSQDELDTSANETEPEDAAPFEPTPAPVPVAEPEPVAVEAEVPVEAEVVPEVRESVGIVIDDSSEQPSVDEVAEEPASDLDSSQAPYHFNETQPIDQLVQQTEVSGNTYEEESASASATNASTDDVEMGPATTERVPPIDEENDNAADVPEEAHGEPMEQEVTDAPKNDESESKNVEEASLETTPADDLKVAQDEPAKDAADSESSSTKKDGEESRKRKRSRSPSPRRRTRTTSTAANADDFTNVEDEPAIDPDKVTLSWFDSDLQLRINSTDFCDARPISDAALGLVWAGARATHGVRTGTKVFYEVQLQQKNSRVNFEQEKNLFNLRCGWSTLDSGLQLGEGALSFGYDGQGKKIKEGTAEDYGLPLEVDDVVGVYLDLESEPCTIEYTVNGASQGVAFEFSKEELGEAALFPHIIAKNLSFKVNFGQLENNLLHDLKAKPKKKPPVEVAAVPAATEEAPAETAAEEKAVEAAKDVGEDAAIAEEKSEEAAVAPPAAETSEEAPVASEETASEAAVTSEETASETAVVSEETTSETPAPVDEEKPAAEAEQEAVSEETPAEEPEVKKTDEDVEMSEEKGAEEEPMAAEEVIEEPLPEINRENLPGYTFIGLIEKEQLLPGPSRPESRKECEVIMMIGLSGAGKSKWVSEWIAEHPEKRYNIIGASALIERMKIPNLGRKIESAGRRQRLSELCTRSMVPLQELAQKRRRNYILDQTNVFASAQRRKMKGFGDFRRMAVIVVPTDEEYARRQESCKNDIDKDNSETEQNDMKANFSLPTMDLGWFDEIKYTDLEEAEATKLVEDYNVKGKKALPPPAKKRPSYDYRNDNRRRDFNSRDRQSRWGSSDNRRGGGGYDNRSGDRWGGSSGRSAPSYHGGAGGGGGGGYRAPSRDYDYDRRPDRWGGGGGGGGGGGHGNGNWMNNNRRDFRSGSGGGGGGGRSDYGSRDYRSGGPPNSRDQQRQPYGGASRDHHSSSSSSSSHHHRRNDGRDQDFRERRREDGGGSNRRYDSARSNVTSAGVPRHDYHKRDNGSAKPSTDLMNNGGGANWQQQLQWNNWQQQGQAQQAAQTAQMDSWGWAAMQQQQPAAVSGWQNWGQTTAAASAGQWKSYGSATTGTGAGSAAGNAAGAAGQATGHWDGHQWTGGSY